MACRVRAGLDLLFLFFFFFVTVLVVHNGIDAEGNGVDEVRNEMAGQDMPLLEDFGGGGGS